MSQQRGASVPAEQLTPRGDSTYPPPRGGAIGIKAVADAANVSITTVSHALSGKGKLPPATRERVQRIAHDLGYRPNASARSLAGGRSGILVMAVSGARGLRFAIGEFSYFVELMMAATAEALDRGYALVLTPDISAQQAALQRVPMDGALVIDPGIDDPAIAELRRREIPLVTTGRLLGDGDDQFWVDIDHVAAAYTVLDHFVKRGAERVALLTPPPTTSFAADSIDGFALWCRVHGREPMIAFAAPELTEDAGFAAAARLLDADRRPDAIYAPADRLAIGVLLAAEARGIRIPEDLLVAGVGDSQAGKSCRPSLTTLNANTDQLGRSAARMLIDAIEGRTPAERHLFVPTRLVARDSTRRARP